MLSLLIFGSLLISLSLSLFTARSLSSQVSLSLLFFLSLLNDKWQCVVVLICLRCAGRGVCRVVKKSHVYDGSKKSISVIVQKLLDGIFISIAVVFSLKKNPSASNYGFYRFK